MTSRAQIHILTLTLTLTLTCRALQRVMYAVTLTCRAPCQSRPQASQVVSVAVSSSVEKVTVNGTPEGAQQYTRRCTTVHPSLGVHNKHVQAHTLAGMRGPEQGKVAPTLSCPRGDLQLSTRTGSEGVEHHDELGTRGLHLWEGTRRGGQWGQGHAQRASEWPGMAEAIRMHHRDGRGHYDAS